MTKRHFLSFAIVLTAAAASFSGAAAISQKAPQPASQPAKAQPGPAKPAQHTQEEGDRIFQQNCSRCHTTPDGFSPRISGTVLRHMRVRASLSEHDEQQLMHFLNP